VPAVKRWTDLDASDRSQWVEFDLPGEPLPPKPRARSGRYARTITRATAVRARELYLHATALTVTQIAAQLSISPSAVINFGKGRREV
jgi:hypothetical protein